MGLSFGHGRENGSIPAGCDRMELQGAQQMKYWRERVSSLKRFFV